MLVGRFLLGQRCLSMSWSSGEHRVQYLHMGSSYLGHEVWLVLRNKKLRDRRTELPSPERCYQTLCPPDPLTQRPTTFNFHSELLENGHCLDDSLISAFVFNTAHFY